MSGTTVTMPGTESLGSDTKAVKTKKQDEIKVGWGEPPVDNIEGQCECKNPRYTD